MPFVAYFGGWPNSRDIRRIAPHADRTKAAPPPYDANRRRGPSPKPCPQAAGPGTGEGEAVLVP